jgi:hypothetical protein
MNRLIKFLFLLFGLLVVACAQDPSEFDLKSPCVDSGFGENSLCGKRSPIENIKV